MPKKCVLLTGARAPVTLELARLFAVDGYRVLVAETVPFHFCRFSRFIDRSYLLPRPVEDTAGFIRGLVDIVTKEEVVMIIPTLEEVFYLAGHREAFPIGCEIFCDTLEKLLKVHHKWQFSCLLNELGLANPHSWLLKSLDDLRAIPLGGEIVLKPVYGRFATHVHLLSSPLAPIPAGVAISEEQPWIAQEFIEGRRISSYSIARDGALTAHSVYPVIFYVGEMGSCLAFEPEEHPGIRTWVEEFVSRTQFTGQIAFDFIEDPSGRFFAIECNPRSTGGAHLFREEDHLPRAFFTHISPPITPNLAVRRQMTLAMLGFAWGSAWRQKQFPLFLQKLVIGHDVVFRWNDPLPFFAQPLVVGMYWWIGRRLHKGTIEASTFDSEWNG